LSKEKNVAIIIAIRHYLLHQAHLKGNQLITPFTDIYINKDGTLLSFKKDAGVLTYTNPKTVNQGKWGGDSVRSRKRNYFTDREIWLSTAPYISAGFGHKYYDVNALYDAYTSHTLCTKERHTIPLRRVCKAYTPYKHW